MNFFRKLWVLWLLRILLVAGLTLLLAMGYYHVLRVLIYPAPPVAATAPLTQPANAEGAGRNWAQPQSVPVTVLLRAAAEVSVDGAQAGLAVSFEDCVPSPAGSPLRMLLDTGTVPEPSLGLTFLESVCLAVDAGASTAAPASLTGVWRSASADALMDFDNAITQWRYTRPDGKASYVTLVSAGYCETDEGDCSAAISLIESSHPEDFFLRLNLPERGMAPLSWSSSGSPSGVLDDF